ncbi:DNA-binding NarL/FixJ family response regulator [Paenibacillus qinlingensis]|uniref:DNA-binding NarL/FixJ family response regulator n=1 Tax=Paenibacillus qinlingensis TaxID=1837343 RepID=A0ABU1NPZ7_9BACL|nr:DNA-binding NarL/FixJ family response regulator [Paenibacillus qinlingensis]
MSFQILVVDDTKFMRKMLTDILKQYGHEVVGEAENGRQAVQKYEELQPDIVLMDITMPEMDGIEAMKEIRKLNPTAVVLICSAMSQQDLISDALKAGANGYVMKPFKPNRVNEIVRKYGVPRVIGHLLPQEMQRMETVPAEMDAEETIFEKEELELQATIAEGANAQVEGLKAVDQAYSEPEVLLYTKQDEQQVHVPEVIELRQSMPEPEMKSPVVEERKVATKPNQVVNALEVLLAFAEVEESKIVLESTDSMQTEDVTELLLSNESEDRLSEMEKLAAAMQGDLDQEWQLEQELLQELQHDQIEEPIADQSEEVNEAESLVVVEQATEEIVVDLEASSIELSLEDLNELTMEMESLANIVPVHEMDDLVNEVTQVKDEAPVITTYKSPEPTDTNRVGFKAVNGGKIINLFRGNGPMKNFTSSVMCNWSEDLNGEMSQYLVVCTEAENKIEIDMTTSSGQKQSITVTIESFNQLAAWLQVQLGTAPVNNREYAKKADF